MDGATECWLQGIHLFPSCHIMYNELGTILGQQGEYQSALQRFTQAVELGSFVAELNKAHILELEGWW